MNGPAEQFPNKLGINKSQFSGEKSEILSHTDFQINEYKNNFQHPNYEPISNNNISVKQALEKLQENTGVSPIDKAASNIFFMCK